MTMVRVLTLALLLACGVLSFGSPIGAAAGQPPDPQAGGISTEALAQIDALIAEKESRTPAQQKIDSQLIYERRMETGVAIADGVWAVETDLPYAGDGHLIVDVRARAGSNLSSRLPGAAFSACACWGAHCTACASALAGSKTVTSCTSCWQASD